MVLLQWMGEHPVLTCILGMILCTAVIGVAEAFASRRPRQDLTDVHSQERKDAA